MDCLSEGTRNNEFDNVEVGARGLAFLSVHSPRLLLHWPFGLAGGILKSLAFQIVCNECVEQQVLVSKIHQQLTRQVAVCGRVVAVEFHCEATHNK